MKTKYLIQKFPSFDGLRIFYHSWSVENPKKLFIIIHGYAEHGTRYEHFAHFLNKNDFDVYAIDLRGHGLSEGARGHINSFNIYTEDLYLFIDKLLKKYKKNKVFALGHSMGGLILTDYLINLSRSSLIRGAILSSPLFKLNMKIPFYSNFLKIFRYVHPALKVNNNINPYNLTHNREIVYKYINDPLIFNTTTVGWFFSMLDKQREVFLKSGDIFTPILILQAGEDYLCNKDGAIYFSKLIKNAKGEIKILDNLYHEILNEISRDTIYNIILEWTRSFEKINIPKKSQEFTN